jgi:CDP-diacylglycerol pyrophosphatase
VSRCLDCSAKSSIDTSAPELEAPSGPIKGPRDYLQIFWRVRRTTPQLYGDPHEKPDRICSNLVMRSDSERLLLHKRSRFAAALGLILAAVTGLPRSVPAADRNALWVVVNDICLPAYRGIGVAFPCAEINIAEGLDRGFAVLKTPSSAAHVIVVPTIRISGIESPALLSENAPNYWEAAWEARRFVDDGAGRQLPRDKIGMAINSAARRSQDQLHIHVACVAPRVAEFLRRHQAEIHETWSFLSSALLGHRFAAMKVETDSLAHVDPFKLLSLGLPSGKFSMGSQTLAVIGATFADGRIGFYLLANDSGASPRAIVSAEALLDAKCAD